jgi:hypothetical protein
LTTWGPDRPNGAGDAPYEDLLAREHVPNQKIGKELLAADKEADENKGLT